MPSANDPLLTASSEPLVDPTARLRRQAKHRFMGAAVLVLLAVVSLPFLLDAPPRPIANSITIDIPKAPSKPGSPVSPPPEKLESVVVAPAATTAPADEAAAPAASSPKVDVPKGQYVVQVGSFADNDALLATTSKLDKAGIKYYKQAATGKDGSPRTRLRLKGSYATKEEAQAATAQVVKLGIPFIVLKL